MSAVSDQDLVDYIDAADGESFFDLVVETFMQSGLTWDHIPDPVVDECLPKFLQIVRQTEPTRLPLDDIVEGECIETSAAWLLKRVNDALADPQPAWSVWLSGTRRGGEPELVSRGETCVEAIEKRLIIRERDKDEISVYPDGKAPWQTDSMPRSGSHRADRGPARNGREPDEG